MDRIIKSLAFDKTVRIYAVDATTCVQDIRAKMQTKSEVTVALGRLAMATVMIGAMESYDAKTYVKIDADGLVGKLYADADAYGNVRAYAQYPHVQLPENGQGKLDISQIVGTKGLLYVIKDLAMKESFVGQTEIVSGELGEDFTRYFTSSQQTPATVGLDVLTDDEHVKVAGGFIAQILPGAQEQVIATLEANLAKIPSLLGFLQESSLEKLLEVLSGGTANILEEIPVNYKCTCSKERFLDVLASLPKTELEDMIADDNHEEVICHYCFQKYIISTEDIKSIINIK
ncbi:MAG: Hsp33 family molecular chaperone HslO [Culicoidibacterales bacterium]